MGGMLSIVGVGPGDPELLTLKAARRIAAAAVVACFARRGRPGNAWQVAAGFVDASAEVLRFEYPFTTEIPADTPEYRQGIGDFYDRCGEAVGARLRAGRDVALLCEGDPFFYGSAMYLFDRLAASHDCEIIPGITGMGGAWARARLPIAHGDDTLSVLPGTLPAPDLAARLCACDAAVIMKVGRNLPNIRAALAEAGRLDRAVYVERGTMPGERIALLQAVSDGAAPYFSLVLVPGRQGVR